MSHPVPTRRSAPPDAWSYPPERQQPPPRHLATEWEGPGNRVDNLPSRRPAVQWLFLVPAALVLAVPLYNRMDPRLFGLPFFYWFQLACAALTILVTVVVHLLTKGRRPRWR